MNKSLYTASELKQERDRLIALQSGIDPITKEPFSEVICVDHCHSTQHTRGALNRNSNAFEGLVFNAYKRCLSWLTDKPLPEILRNLASYLEQDYSKNPYHPSFTKSLKTQFNKLPAKRMDEVLVELGSTPGKNLVERKAKFAKVVLDRKLGYNTILNAIKKGNT